MNRFPSYRIEKSGEMLTPYRGSVAGPPVTVTDTMTESEVVQTLMASCATLDG
jgi:hypothetical protein